MKDVHIGHEILARLVKLRMSKSEFARRMGLAQQNINRILESPHIYTDKLQQVSEILGFDFFSLYQNDRMENKAVAIGDNPIAAINSEVMSTDCSVLQERVRHLEQLLMEKERMIQYLMRDVQRDIKQ
jgi:transcriptional regulator with XRE-family HTH domain